MKTFGESDLHAKVSTGNNLASVVKVVEQLPDPIATADGIVLQLMNSQPGYTATHVYLCVDNTWKDITSNPSVTQDTDEKAFAAGYIYQYDVVTRLCAWWSTPDDPEDDSWQYDVLVRKLGEYPNNPSDGEVLTFSTVRDEYVNVTEAYSDGKTSSIDSTKVPYYPSDKAYHSGVINGTSADGRSYFYRVFHVYASGAVTYINCDVMDESYVAGVIGYLKLARTMHDVQIAEATSVPYSTLAVWESPAVPPTATNIRERIVCVMDGTEVEVMTPITPTTESQTNSCRVISSDGKYRAMRKHQCWWKNTVQYETHPDYPIGPGARFIIRTTYRLNGVDETFDRALTYVSGWEALQLAIAYKVTDTYQVSSYKYSFLGVPHSFAAVSPVPTNYWVRAAYLLDTGLDNCSIWMQEQKYPGHPNGVWFRCVCGNVGITHERPVPDSSAWQLLLPDSGLHDHATLVYAGPMDSARALNFWYNPFVIDFVIE